MSYSPELLSGLAAFLLTLFVLSYLIGDQAFFRAAVYIFIGASAGYVAVVAWHQVLVPQLLRPLLYGAPDERILAIFPLILSLLLFAKAVPAFSKVGLPPVAMMVGVGAAVAIGGAVSGTIFPQTTAAIDALDVRTAAFPAEQFIEGALMLLGTVTTLVYFQFSARRRDDGKYRRNPLTNILALIGGVFIAITFGVLLAGVYSAALTALIDRLDFMISIFQSLKNLWLP